MGDQLRGSKAPLSFNTLADMKGLFGEMTTSLVDAVRGRDRSRTCALPNSRLKMMIIWVFVCLLVVYLGTIIYI